MAKIIQRFRRLFHWMHSQKDAVVVENWEATGLPGQEVRSNFIVCPKCGIKTYIEPTWKAGKRVNDDDGVQKKGWEDCHNDISERGRTV